MLEIIGRCAAPTIVTGALHPAIYIYTGYDYDFLFLAEIAGPILLLAFIHPIFRKMYTHWYALPED